MAKERVVDEAEQARDANAAFTEGADDENVLFEINQSNHLSAQDIQAQERITIIIHNGSGPEGNKPVFVAAQGFAVQIPRQKPISVPIGIVNALRDAVETHYFREEKDGVYFGPILSVDVPRFPFAVVG